GIAQPGLAQASLQEAAGPALERRRSALDVAHPPVAGLAQARARGGIGDRGLEAAELVHQAAFARLLAGPDPPARNLVDLLGGLAAALGRAGDEVAVALVDVGLDDLRQLRRHWPGEIERAGDARGRHA